MLGLPKPTGNNCRKDILAPARLLFPSTYLRRDSAYHLFPALFDGSVAGCLRWYLAVGVAGRLKPCARQSWSWDVFLVGVHPGRLRWNLLIDHLERKMIFQTSMVMFHVNLPGYSWFIRFKNLRHNFIHIQTYTQENCAHISRQMRKYVRIYEYIINKL